MTENPSSDNPTSDNPSLNKERNSKKDLSKKDLAKTRCVSVSEKSEIESLIESVNERSPELAAKLSEFLEYRKAIKKPMRPVSFPAFIKKLVKDS